MKPADITPQKILLTRKFGAIKVLGLDEPPQTGLIFCSHDGSPINYCTDYCRFKRFLEASGVEIKRSGTD